MKYTQEFQDELKRLDFYPSGIGFNHKTIQNLKLFIHLVPNQKVRVIFSSFDLSFNYCVAQISEINELELLMKYIDFDYSKWR